MEIVGIEVNDIDLIYVGNEDSTGFYRAFMRYCIDNYFHRIIMSDTLQTKFRLTANDPDFRRSLVYRRVEGYNGLYFSTWNGTKEKIRIIKLIAEQLGIDLYIHTFELIQLNPRF